MPDSVPLLDPQPLASNPVQAKGPWGAGMTLVFGFVVFLAYSIIQTLAMAPVLTASLGPRFNAAQVTDIMTLGFNLALATALGCPAMLILCALLVIARGGPSLESYLALHRIRPAKLVAWLIGMLAFVLSMSALNEALQRPVPDFISKSFATAGHLPFFFVAVGLCAPIAEEVFFRGFLYRGLAQSPLRAGGAILFTSLVFMLVHAGQYDWFDLTQVGLVGLVLGIARWRSDSLLPPLAMHSLLNLTSLTLYTFEAARPT